MLYITQMKRKAEDNLTNLLSAISLGEDTSHKTHELDIKKVCIRKLLHTETPEPSQLIEDQAFISKRKRNENFMEVDHESSDAQDAAKKTKTDVEILCDDPMLPNREITLQKRPLVIREFEVPVEVESPPRYHWKSIYHNETDGEPFV